MNAFYLEDIEPMMHHARIRREQSLSELDGLLNIPRRFLAMQVKCEQQDISQVRQDSAKIRNQLFAAIERERLKKRNLSASPLPVIWPNGRWLTTEEARQKLSQSMVIL